jgi:hypothetical protein
MSAAAESLRGRETPVAAYICDVTSQSSLAEAAARPAIRAGFLLKYGTMVTP